jgi:hypothetical protein
MEVHFTPEQEAQSSQIASHAGTDTERLVKDAALRLLEQDARFSRRGAGRHRAGRPGGRAFFVSRGIFSRKSAATGPSFVLWPKPPNSASN